MIDFDPQPSSSIAASEAANRVKLLEEPMEAAFQGQTYAMIGDRSRMQQDHAFLRHYVEVSQQSASEHEVRAVYAAQAAQDMTATKQTLEQEFSMVKSELAQQEALVRNLREVLRQKEASLMELRRRVGHETSRLRQALDAEERALAAARQHTMGLQQAVEAAQREAASQAANARQSRAQADEAEEAKIDARIEAKARDELAAVAVQTALTRLEGDFAKERALLQVRERNQQSRLQDLGRAVDTSVGMAGVRASARPAVAAAAAAGAPPELLERLGGPAAAPPISIAPVPTVQDACGLPTSPAPPGARSPIAAPWTPLAPPPMLQFSPPMGQLAPGMPPQATQVSAGGPANAAFVFSP
mmetsp:Transcript_137379/g.293572  ORF Transcript_137379/g.293572 Transcript_137379/m.293572 type:complete len:358 (+) Transcript_137379:139-1212(+)